MNLESTRPRKEMARLNEGGWKNSWWRRVAGKSI
jgi:hypothetical protein